MTEVLHTGVDMIEVHRLREAIERHGDRFLRRIYTEAELKELKGNLPSLAARWAGKEAVAKALAIGIGDLSWQDVEILRGPNREPVLHLSGAAERIAKQRGITGWSITISHTHEHALAFVVAS